MNDYKRHHEARYMTLIKEKNIEEIHVLREIIIETYNDTVIYEANFILKYRSGKVKKFTLKNNHKKTGVILSPRLPLGAA